MSERETRHYPFACQSAQCGRIECSGCPMKPKLDEFKTWRERTKATQPDHIWSPTIWEASRND
jgi:hypothetical protein